MGGRLKPEKGKESQRLRAAAALAKYDPESEKWAKCSPLVVNDLVLENPCFLGQWSEAFRPVRKSLLRSVGRHLPRSQPGASGGTHPGNEPAGRLRRRPAAGFGRPAHGRRREAVRRDLSEVQGSWRARFAPADRRDRHETASGLALLGRQAGNAGEAAGECGGGPLENEPARQGLAALEAQPRSDGCGAI